MQQRSVFLNHHTATFDWRSRLRAAGIHLALSALVAALAGVLVFAVWYPYPYREISGGRELFRLVVSVDVILGPLITFAVFDRAKRRTELRRDLAVVGLLQCAALMYGLWTVHLARPVHMVFEYDRFRVVHQIDIPPEELAKTPPGLQAIPWGSPTLLTLRPFRNAAESADMTVAALGGVQLAARPELWQAYEAGRAEVLKAARPVSQLKTRFAARAAEIDQAVREAGGDPATALSLPLIARKADAWTVLLEPGTARVIGYVPLDSF
jgi:hypothetical protein